MDLILEKLETWGDKIISGLPNFILALVVLVAFVFLARLVRRAVKKLLYKAYKNIELVTILSRIAFVAIIITGGMIALSVLDLDKTVTSILAGAGIVGLALSFAFQDLAANLISGFYMAAKNPFQVGDVIKVNDNIGEVKEIQLRSTLIQSFDGNEVRIPNRILFENPITNYYETKTRRIDLEVGVSYAEDLDFVQEVATKAIEKLPITIKDEEVQILYTEFGGSSINLEVRYWVPYETYLQYLEGISEGVKAIKKAFDENGISIPFPIRTLDFGIKGGQTLSESMNQIEEKV